MYCECITKEKQFSFLSELSARGFVKAVKAATFLMLNKADKFRKTASGIKYHEYGHEFSVAFSIFEAFKNNTEFFNELQQLNPISLLEQMLVVAFLHDVLEDCKDVRLYQLNQFFGCEVGTRVNMLTNKYSTGAENHEYSIEAICDDLTTFVVKPEPKFIW